MYCEETAECLKTTHLHTSPVYGHNCTSQLLYKPTNSSTVCVLNSIINKVLIKLTLNKVIAGALYIVICGWNAVKVQGWQLPVLTSRTNRTALLTPCTRACVHAARSRDVWTRNTWASTPCRVPDLVPNVRMSPPPAIDGCFPEWTSLQLHTHRYAYWVCSSSAMSSQ